jgi:hypothetical protein
MIEHTLDDRFIFISGKSDWAQTFNYEYKRGYYIFVKRII